MQRWSVTTRLVVEASCMLHDTVGVLSDLDRGAAMRAVGTDTMNVASQRTRAVSSRSELAILPSIFVD